MFDYTTVEAVLAYGNTSGMATSPTDARRVIAGLIPQVSRIIDQRAQQAFSLATYTQDVRRAVVDRDGCLMTQLACPVVASLTAAAYRVGGAAAWQSLAGVATDIQAAPHGATIRWLDYPLPAARFGRVQVQLSYSGGYADRDALPADFVWLATAATWFEFQRRAAPAEQTAMPELGMVVTPGVWPANLRAVLNHYTRVVA